jgi:hypothetical protein
MAAEVRANLKRKRRQTKQQMNGNKRKSKGDGAGNSYDDDDEESYDSIAMKKNTIKNITTITFCWILTVTTTTTTTTTTVCEMLILRDIARPLEACDFDLDGKVGMEPSVPAEDEDEGDAFLWPFFCGDGGLNAANEPIDGEETDAIVSAIQYIAHLPE